MGEGEGMNCGRCYHLAEDCRCKAMTAPGEFARCEDKDGTISLYIGEEVEIDFSATGSKMDIGDFEAAIEYINAAVAAHVQKAVGKTMTVVANDLEKEKKILMGEAVRRAVEEFRERAAKVASDTDYGAKHCCEDCPCGYWATELAEKLRALPLSPADGKTEGKA